MRVFVFVCVFVCVHVCVWSRCFQAEGFNGNIMHASVGNVTSETEFSFEYKGRKSHTGSAGDQKGDKG